MRTKLHYLGMMIIIPVYGIQVCPFIEGLNPLEVFASIGGLLILTFLLRAPIMKRWADSKPLVEQVRRVFALDMCLFVSVGIILTLYNYALHDFPLASGLKVLVGIISMGIFASIDAALVRERLIAEKIEHEGLTLEASKGFYPLALKLGYFSAALTALIVGVFLLLVIKDLDWLVEVGSTVSIVDARISILKEFGFVLAVLMIEAINIIMSFSRNLNMSFIRENTVLEKIAAGQYDAKVPVCSNNEFGVMATHTNEMIRQISERNEELNSTRDATILTLASLAETRDNETGAHILRTQRYVKALALYLQARPAYSNELTDETIDLLYKSAPLHDIGKVGIPDAILLKPGKLSTEEFEIMKGHAQIGADALLIAEEHLGTNSFLRLARVISLSHHEKWDGSGYPAGLSGSDIPLAGRLMAVADVYDALISKRVYKPAFSHDKAMEIIREGKGAHFDPDIIDALDAIEEQFIAIAEEFGDKVTAEELPQSA